jgi:hypothetical protein
LTYHINKIIKIAENIPNKDGIKSFLESVPDLINKITPENKEMISKIIDYDFPSNNGVSQLQGFKKPTTPRTKKKKV